ncbi:mRNA capping enzyme, beta chain [[Emmonsia] crescens]|uniref:mRNA-capping enzyme subunit beta n=1 Tax=[Emmonsia] crescens TaxID=73230 RepID=A0A0G2IZF0_9EURO|nr:mRNA capping enzyme, beta chain [Emmonsia crescens UAMH 3008]
MNYNGNVSELSVASDVERKEGDRVKNRMSYRHLAFQIDLTQVSTQEANAPSPPGFDHELEIEISAAEVRHQGKMVLAGDQRNQY